MTEQSSILPSEFNARRTADLVSKIEAINLGSKEPLTRTEIQVLSKMNAAMVTAMKDRLNKEANTIWDKTTDAATNAAHKAYWEGYATRLQGAIDAYDGKLAQITTGSREDLANLAATNQAENVFSVAAKINSGKTKGIALPATPTPPTPDTPTPPDTPVAGKPTATLITKTGTKEKKVKSKTDEEKFDITNSTLR